MLFGRVLSPALILSPSQSTCCCNSVTAVSITLRPKMSFYTAYGTIYKNTCQHILFNTGMVFDWPFSIPKRMIPLFRVKKRIPVKFCPRVIIVISFSLTVLFEFKLRFQYIVIFWNINWNCCQIRSSSFLFFPKTNKNI